MLYIHIPFCKSICSYCDFYHTSSLIQVESVVNKIVDELTLRHDFIGDSIKTIYFGGGTPSVLNATQIGKILDKVSQLWQLDLVEVTFEANPEDITFEYAVALRQLGINRLSMGVQSFCDEHLTLFNRRHTSARAIEAILDARRAGFENISIDLIYGMPFMTIEQWQSNIDKAIECDVEHISAYHLTIEPKTVFGKKKMQSVDDETSQQHYDMLCKSLQEAGYEHYEISNFAKSNLRAVHNSGYWRGVHYLGVGPSAHSYDGATRHWNVSSNKLYLEGNVGETEILSETDIKNEQIMISLRTSDGLAAPDGAILKRAKRFLNSGDMEYCDGVLRIPENRWLVSDYIISELFY